MRRRNEAFTPKTPNPPHSPPGQPPQTSAAHNQHDPANLPARERAEKSNQVFIQNFHAPPPRLPFFCSSYKTCAYVGQLGAGGGMRWGVQQVEKNPAFENRENNPQHRAERRPALRNSHSLPRHGTDRSAPAPPRPAPQTDRTKPSVGGGRSSSFKPIKHRLTGSSGARSASDLCVTTHRRRKSRFHGDTKKPACLCQEKGCCSPSRIWIWMSPVCYSDVVSSQNQMWRERLIET